MASWGWEASPAPARRPCIETVVLAGVCLLDLIATVALIQTGQAVEGNPLMAYFLQFGIATFCTAKLAFVVPPLLVAEWYRQHNDRLVRSTLRFVAVAYVAVLVGGSLALNPHLL